MFGRVGGEDEDVSFFVECEDECEERTRVSARRRGHRGEFPAHTEET